VNTVFEVAKNAGMTTAWSDKHPAYEILNGPSGKGVDDLFTPEINSNAAAPFSGDWTKDNAATQQYDGHIGSALLSRFHMFIDFPGHRIILEKRSAANHATTD
jgi:alpha-ketoglutarate-dependent taurine dioxygenase